MQAIRVHVHGDSSVMKLDEAPDPQPGAGQVLVRIHAAGVNPVDTYIRAGGYGRLPSLPYTPGIDAAGVIEAVGQGADLRRGTTTLKPGDRVWVCALAGGTYAQRVTAQAHEVHALPGGVRFEEGARLGVPCLTAWRAMMQIGAARPGQSVLIHGASGGVGSACVQIASASGLRVIGTAGTTDGLAFVRKLGCEAAFNHREKGYEEQIMDATGGRGPDLIVEMLANVNLERDMGLVAPRGRIIVVGNRGQITVNPRGLMGKDSSVHGMALFNASREELLECASGVEGGLRAGWLRPVVQEVMPLRDAPRAHEWVMTDGKRGSVVLSVE
ncbi:MAG: NADPH:quinone reductase [Leptolyngbya sp. PLA3]|nr:MAG: NADPH:quinone reductase [Cyanobacteria bacterium CYA]MCE7968963.1 NADPH:quinone reductase [Leptolyngbya sp. PL-A3]